MVYKTFPVIFSSFPSENCWSTTGIAPTLTSPIAALPHRKHHDQDDHHQQQQQHLEGRRQMSGFDLRQHNFPDNRHNMDFRQNRGQQVNFLKKDIVVPAWLCLTSVLAVAILNWHYLYSGCNEKLPSPCPSFQNSPTAHLQLSQRWFRWSVIKKSRGGVGRALSAARFCC